jgi:RNA polymerase sigma-70 factor (ECF subfamily)
MDERQAIAKMKAGDWEGLEPLVHAFQTQALHAAYLIVQDRALAEDVVQEAFLNAYLKIVQFDDNRPFRPWFLKSVVNAAIKAARRQNRQVSLNRDDQDKAAGLLDRLVSGNPAPEDWVVTEETRRAVRIALAQLTPAQRAAVVMRHYLEMSAEEMAVETDSSVATVKWRLHAARRRLREILGRSFGPSRTKEEE